MALGNAAIPELLDGKSATEALSRGGEINFF